MKQKHFISHRHQEKSASAVSHLAVLQQPCQVLEAVAVEKDGLENRPVRAQEHVPDGVWRRGGRRKGGTVAERQITPPVNPRFLVFHLLSGSKSQRHEQIHILGYC